MELARDLAQRWTELHHPFAELLPLLCGTKIALWLFFGMQAILYFPTAALPKEYRAIRRWRTQLLLSSIGLVVSLIAYPYDFQAVQGEVQAWLHVGTASEREAAWLHLETASESEGTCPAIMGLIEAGY